MASVTGTPVVVTDAGAVLADTHTASAAGLDLIFIVSERGISGTSPTVLTYGGIDVIDALDADPDTGPITALAQIAAASRAHRAYRLSKAKHPGTGTHAVACSWAGTDNIGIAIIEIASTGAISIADTNFNSSGDDVTITALDGDLTISCAQGNSATPNFSPSSGQTEILETVWYSNTGHVVGVQTGAQSASNWTSAGSTCASAFVIHEEADEEPEEIGLGGEALGAGRVTSAAASIVTLGGALMGAGRVTGFLEPRITAGGEAHAGGRVAGEGAPVASGGGSALGTGLGSGAVSPLATATGSARGAGRATGAGVPLAVASGGSLGAGRVSIAAYPSITAGGEARGQGRVQSAAPANELGVEARGGGYVMGSVTPTAGLAGTVRGGGATASAAVTVRSVAAGIARGVGRALGAVLSAIGLGGEARAAGRAAGRVGAVAVWAPGPPERTRVAMSRALRSRMSYPRGNVRTSGFRARRVK